MNKYRLISIFLVVIAWVMFASASIIQQSMNLKQKVQTIVVATDIVEAKDLATSKRVLTTIKEEEQEEKVKAVSMEAVPEPKKEEETQKRIEVYEGMTLEELGAKLDRSLKNELYGKGTLIASHSLEVGADPIIVTAIMLLETGCNWKCSRLMLACNNVGGQKGSPRCGNGSYKYYETLDDGIRGVIDNLGRNYFNIGLTTPETIGPKYAESKTWTEKVNSYI